MDNHTPDDSPAPDLQELTQQFLENAGPFSGYEIDDLRPFVGEAFAITNVKGESCGEIILSHLDEHSPNETSRRLVRKQPFSMIFSHKGTVLMESGFYKLEAKNSDTIKHLFLKPLDFSEEENLNIYEAVIN